MSPKLVNSPNAEDTDFMGAPCFPWFSLSGPWLLTWCPFFQPMGPVFRALDCLA